jgi:hypothetical protein
MERRVRNLQKVLLCTVTPFSNDISHLYLPPKLHACSKKGSNSCFA